MTIDGTTIALGILILAIVFTVKSLKIVPQQHAWVVERLGKYDRTLAPGLNVIVPFLDRVAYRHVLKEIPLDVPSQICITRDNTQLTVDGVLYFQVTDAMRASYGSSNYVAAITQLAQTTLRSVIGRMELDKTFEERDAINAAVVAALDDAARNWGVKVLRYEIKDLTPPAEILRAMQAQITAEREKRAVIATSEGRRQEQINLASGERESSIQRSEGERQAEINRAQGEAAAIAAIADATARAIERVGAATHQPGGMEALNLRVADRYIDAFEKLARTNNTLILPSNLSDIAGLVSSALTVVKATGDGGAGGRGPAARPNDTTSGGAAGTAPRSAAAAVRGPSAAGSSGVPIVSASQVQAAASRAVDAAWNEYTTTGQQRGITLPGGARLNIDFSGFGRSQQGN